MCSHESNAANPMVLVVVLVLVVVAADSVL